MLMVVRSELSTSADAPITQLEKSLAAQPIIWAGVSRLLCDRPAAV
jgi:hypothetical protein